jgi:hypothetical protein
MAAEGAAKARDWAKLYLACLVLLDKGQPLPTNLSTLPIGNIVDADEVFFEAELLYRQAEMDLSSIRGQQGRNNGRSIALGLLIQRQEDLRRARARALQLNWDEQQQQTQDTEQNSGDRSIALNVKGNM